MKPEALDYYRQMMDWYMNGKLGDRKPSLPSILRDV
jgi:hypothetical protein